MALNVPAVGVVDFSFDRLTGAQLAAAGAAGVIRYASGGRPDVNITAAEYADLAAHNIPAGITCEEAATFMTGGYDAGARNAQAALDVTRAAGIPDGPIFFAVDFDANSSYMPALLDTLNGCAAVLGAGNAGVYAEYEVLDWLTHNSPYTAFWQTAAWSRGQVHPKAWLIQDRIWTIATPYKLDGANVDFSTVLGDWHPRQEDTMSAQDVAQINAHTDQQVANLATLLAARFDRGDAADKQIAQALTTIYGPQKKDGSGPVDPTHTGIGDLARALKLLPAGMATAVTTGLEQHSPNVTVDQAALEAAVAAAIDAHLSGATITLTPKAGS